MEGATFSTGNSVLLLSTLFFLNINIFFFERESLAVQIKGGSLRQYAVYAFDHLENKPYAVTILITSTIRIPNGIVGGLILSSIQRRNKSECYHLYS